MSEQDGTQATTLKRPTNDDKEAWKAYWWHLGQDWRTEPEIDIEQQQFLNERLTIKADWRQDIYPFKDIKLTRADVEWLLATHKNGRFTSDLDDVNHRERGRLDLIGADLKGIDLQFLSLTEVSFREAQLQGADLRLACLQGATLCGAQLQGANISKTTLADAHHIGPQLADVQWSDTNLADVDWSKITILGDEFRAKQKLEHNGEKQSKDIRLKEYKEAARAKRQLSIALRNQGLDDASRFAYRAQLMQRKVLWYQHKYLSFFGSLFLDLLSGYGYKVGRCFIARGIRNDLSSTRYSPCIERINRD